MSLLLKTLPHIKVRLANGLFSHGAQKTIHALKPECTDSS